jgi:Ca2+-binding RTX toxin-like protein
VLNGGAGVDTLIGNLGNDVYQVDSTTDIITENANEGTDTIQSSVTFSLAALPNIENLTLQGTAISGTGNEFNNSITGNSSNNILIGGGGNDVLNGSTGADSLTGGTGNDVYYIDNAGDSITELSGEGTDTVYSTVDYTFVGTYLENLTLQGTAINSTGNEFNNSITGNASNNILSGGAGNDVLNGSAGTDSLTGGTGNDSYYIDNAGDTITELSGEGTDIVYSTLDYTLAANLENLTLQGTAINGTGNEFNNSITGNASNNILSGGAGNDTLNGSTGADSLIGGTGNDSYYIDNAGDSITELSGEGTDIVYSTLDYTLVGTYLENLTLQGTAINGTGNELNNSITGNASNNILSGGAGNDVLNGSAGTDSLTGGTGNDVYYIDNAGDTITELSGEGTDIVYSTLDYTLVGTYLENLTLQGTAINGTGNELNNSITGNASNNILSGGSGNDVLNGSTGADSLIGGTGNDSYYIDNVSDTITESSGEGTDTVYSTVNYTLAANLENLVLQGTAINGTGNELNNSITGNASNNILSGGSGNDVLNGSTGADSLIGGTGNDSYYIDNAGDSITELSGEGTDIVYSTLDYTLVGTYLENLTLQGTAINGTGNELNNSITGNASNNILSGGAGNDTLNGSTGADSLIGGTGNDVYYIENAGDTITELSGEGTETVYSTLDYTFVGTYLENLVLQGTAINGTGNELNNSITGNASNNILSGGAGNDTLNGSTGADILTGGGGNDILYLGSDTIAGTIDYASGDGSDTVYNFVRGVGGDVLNFVSIPTIDVQVSGTSTLFKVGDGISGNSGFGAGTLLLTTSATSGFVSADVNVNLLGATFAFS